MRYSNYPNYAGGGGCVYGAGWFAGEELACGCDATAVEGGSGAEKAGGGVK